MDQTVAQTINSYLNTIHEARSENTFRSYSTAMNAFREVLKEHWIDSESPVSMLKVDAISWMLSHLKVYSVATERLYTQSVKGYFQYLAGENLAEINIPRMDLLIQKRSRRSGIRLPHFPREDIEEIISFVNSLTNTIYDNPGERLRAYRDRAFILTLADTGLRVHEACNLHRGDIDWNEGRALLIGKGNKQAIVRFSSRCMESLKDYLFQRASIDGSAGRPLSSLPLFARHDKGAGRKIKPITTATGRNIINDRVHQALGTQAQKRITPHSFRHYFVTTVLRAKGNLKLAQELARHASIQVTQRYAHLSDDELDKGYHDIFEK